MTEALTRAERVLAGKMAFTLYVTSRDEYGTPQYFYLRVPGDRMQEFRNALAKGNIDPEAYGARILHWGYGEPDEALKAEMQSDNILSIPLSLESEAA